MLGRVSAAAKGGSIATSSFTLYPGLTTARQVNAREPSLSTGAATVRYGGNVSQHVPHEPRLLQRK